MLLNRNKGNESMQRTELDDKKSDSVLRDWLHGERLGYFLPHRQESNVSEILFCRLLLNQIQMMFFYDVSQKTSGK